jgi:peptidoglycan/LPS O-acetylase OafA/YrhL
MTKCRSKLGNIRELDGLRGAAILGVMFFHSGTPLMKGGFIGVDIFFVLSGFLITTMLIREFDISNSINLKNFYMRRMLRLGPALITLLIVFCLTSFSVLSIEKAHSNYIDAMICFAAFSNWARAFSIHPPYLLNHTWSLSIEQQFYIVWPIIFWILLHFFKNRYHLAIVTASIAFISWLLRICLLMNGATALRLYNGLDTRADALVIGCILGIVLSSQMITEDLKVIMQRYLMVIAPLAVACLLAYCTIGNWLDRRMYYFGFVIIELLTTTLILDILINPKSIIRRLFAMKWLTWIGTISYGLYLWHYPIYGTMAALGYNDYIITIGSFITFLVAALSYYVLERPMLNLKKLYG